MREVISAILKEAVSWDGEETPYYKGCKPVKLNKENFEELAGEDKEAVFIDGGNAELLKAPNLSLQLVRTAAVRYGRERKVEKKQFLLLVVAKGNDLKTKTFPETEFSNKTFRSDDELLREGSRGATPSKIGCLIRRLAELSAAAKYDCLKVLDGSFEASYPGEQEYLSKIRGYAALSKTSTVRTASGKSVGAILSKMNKGSWVYKNLFEDNPMVFVKLHPSSKHVFRLESDEESSAKVLKHYSKDPVFPGYPYGLVEADREARISSQEKDYYRTKLMAEAGKDWEAIEELTFGSDAHDLLDNIRVM